VLDDLYKREAELEGDDRARKGGEKDVDPQGEDDDSMDFGVDMEDKDTQTGNVTMETGTQYEPTGKSKSVQTGRNVEKVSSDDFGMISSGLYLNIERLAIRPVSLEMPAMVKGKEWLWRKEVSAIRTIHG
jgi:hypothetical protein